MGFHGVVADDPYLQPARARRDAGVARARRLTAWIAAGAAGLAGGFAVIAAHAPLTRRTVAPPTATTPTTQPATQPAAGVPVTDAPVTDPPVTDAPVTDPPVTAARAPVTAAPQIQPPVQAPVPSYQYPVIVSGGS
jgi:hypothetical protein